MNRRDFLQGAAAAVAIGGLVGCGPVKDILPSLTQSLQTAEVDMKKLFQAATQQQCELWCWAASISMIFAYYGHPVDQKRIVAETYGDVVCLSADSSTTIGRAMSRPWTDDLGFPFVSQVVAAYDYFNGFYTLNNYTIVNALKTGNPLLYCNTHHAMVNYSVSYYDSPGGPDVREVGVVDPWPFSPQFHALTIPEMVAANLGGEMTFLAEVMIQ